MTPKMIQDVADYLHAGDAPFRQLREPMQKMLLRRAKNLIEAIEKAGYTISKPQETEVVRDALGAFSRNVKKASTTYDPTPRTVPLEEIYPKYNQADRYVK